VEPFVPFSGEPPFGGGSDDQGYSIQQHCRFFPLQGTIKTRWGFLGGRAIERRKRCQFLFYGPSRPLSLSVASATFWFIRFIKQKARFVRAFFYLSECARRFLDGELSGGPIPILSFHPGNALRETSSLTFRAYQH
jgi:hypothetical protein